MGEVSNLMGEVPQMVMHSPCVDPLNFSYNLQAKKSFYKFTRLKNISRRIAFVKVI